MNSEQQAIQACRNWLENIVIGLNLCPFAKQPLQDERIRFVACESDTIEDILYSVIEECHLLESDDSIETTLIVFPNNLQQFDEYLDILEIARTLMEKQGYEGLFQLASFHPSYIFEGSNNEDTANYTNRSPYPIIHIIREASLEEALQNFPNPEKIPERNIKRMRELGLEKMKTLLVACKK